MKRELTLVLLVISLHSYSQEVHNVDTLRKEYFAQQKIISNEFERAFYPFRRQIYSLDEQNFLAKIESLKAPFEKEAIQYKKLYQSVDGEFIRAELRDIEYFFDGIIQGYPYFHENHTGKKVVLSWSTRKRLNKHLKDFNNPELLSSRDVKSYIEGFLRFQSSVEVGKAIYRGSDNKRLQAYLNLIPRYFSNQECKDFWEYRYISEHIEDWGSKNIERIVLQFKATCKNENYRRQIDSLYVESFNSRKGHLIKTYKIVDGYDLDIHLFLPDSLDETKKSPVMVYFSGGSWTKGNPEWAFYGCASYAKKGWVGVSVEYRLADRHETTPFEAVKDARSAIRWLRMNADVYNIDTSRIVASGNSAGGHLVLTTALAKEWNEVTDNLNYSASPNLLLVNAGVYNLYAESNTDWITRDLEDKTLAEKISPIHLLRKGLPPMLIIHGTNDQSVEYATAKAFASEMEKLGNAFEFHTLQGAPHAIWFDRRFSGKVSSLRKEFLKKNGYE